MASPTQRTIHRLKQQGRLWCGVVERFIAQAGPHGRRFDLFGIIDAVVLDPAHGIVGVQSCGNSFSEHFRKITTDGAEAAQEWLKCGGRLELWAWRKVKRKLGSGAWSKGRYWQPRVHVFNLKDFESGAKETK